MGGCGEVNENLPFKEGGLRKISGFWRISTHPSSPALNEHSLKNKNFSLELKYFFICLSCWQFEFTVPWLQNVNKYTKLTFNRPIKLQLLFGCNQPTKLQLLFRCYRPTKLQLLFRCYWPTKLQLLFRCYRPTKLRLLFCCCKPVKREILLAQIRNQYPGYFCFIFNVTWYFSFQTSLYKNRVPDPS